MEQRILASQQKTASQRSTTNSISTSSELSSLSSENLNMTGPSTSAAGTSGNQNNPGNQNRPMSTRKMPKPGEKNAPAFDTDKPEELGRFFERMEDWFEDEGIDDDMDRKRRIVRYLDPDSEIQWKALSKFEDGTFAEFKAQVMAAYPKAEEINKGSVTALKKRIRKLNQVAADDRDELLNLIRVMTAEVKKLKVIQPPIHTNRELVELFLERLLPDFAARVANKLSVHRLLTAGQPGAEAVARNTEDMYDIEEVMRMANHSSLEHANPFGKYLGNVFGTVGPDTGGKLEEAVARLTDSIDIQAKQNKQMEQRLSQMQNSLLQGRSPQVQNQPQQSYNRGPAPQQNYPNQQYANDGLCFYCRGPHRFAYCDDVKIHTEAGWIKRTEQGLRFLDGSRIPKDGTKTMKEVVEAAHKGLIPMAKIQDKTGLYQAGAKMTTLTQSLQTEEDAQKTLEELIQRIGLEKVQSMLNPQSQEDEPEEEHWVQNFD